MTVRRNGADAGTLNTRMGFLIRDQAASWHGRILGAISNSTDAGDALTVITRQRVSPSASPMTGSSG
jgi:hypothetical protein